MEGNELGRRLCGTGWCEPVSRAKARRLRVRFLAEWERGSTGVEVDSREPCVPCVVAVDQLAALGVRPPEPPGCASTTHDEPFLRNDISSN